MSVPIPISIPFLISMSSPPSHERELSPPGCFCGLSDVERSQRAIETRVSAAVLIKCLPRPMLGSALALAVAVALAHCRICTGPGPSLERTLLAGHCWQNNGLAGVPSPSQQDWRLRGVSCTRAVTAAVAAAVTANDPRLATSLLVLSSRRQPPWFPSSHSLRLPSRSSPLLPFPPLPTPSILTDCPPEPPPPTLNRPSRESYTPKVTRKATV